MSSNLVEASSLEPLLANSSCSIFSLQPPSNLLKASRLVEVASGHAKCRSVKFDCIVGQFVSVSAKLNKLWICQVIHGICWYILVLYGYFGSFLLREFV